MKRTPLHDGRTASTRTATAGVALLLGALLASCVSIPVGEDDLFSPRRTVTPETFGAPGTTLEEVTLSSADPAVELSAWWLEAEGARATVLLFGGRDFHLVHSAGYLDLFASLPVNALLVEYRGYGRSGGEPSMEALMADAGELHRYLTRDRGVSASRLIVHGHFVGSFPALALADAQEVGGVVLESPVTQAEDWAGALLPWYTRIFVRADFDRALRGYNNRARIRRVHEPVLIAAGTADRLVPPDLARELHDEAVSAHNELVIVEGGGHDNLHRYEAYRAGYERLLQAVAGEGAGD